MKKLIISVLSVIILFNFILPKNTCQAEIDNDESAFKAFSLSGAVTVKSSVPFLTSINLSKLFISNIVDKVVKALIQFPIKLVNYLVEVLMDSLRDLSHSMFMQNATEAEKQQYELEKEEYLLSEQMMDPSNAIEAFFRQLFWGDYTKYEDLTDEEKADKIIKANRYSVENLILGKYEVLDINFFNNDKTTDNYWLKHSVQFFYTIIRTIAIVGSLMTLIYIGIRLAISTVAEDKAKYKKYLINWAISLALVFLMHYILLIIITIEGVMANVLSLFYNGNILVESEVIDHLESVMVDNSGWAMIADLTIWVVIMFYQFSFLLKYLKRMIKMAFLTIISPLITITYSIGNKGAFQSWLKEVVLLIFMPIIHGVVFIIFMVAASEIIKKAPFLTIIMFIAMNKGEEIVRKTFNLNGDDDQKMGKFKLNPFKK